MSKTEETTGVKVATGAVGRVGTGHLRFTGITKSQAVVPIAAIRLDKSCGRHSLCLLGDEDMWDISASVYAQILDILGGV